MSVAGTFPDDFRASISCYGVGIVSDKPDTPHRLANQVRGEMFFAFAETDEYVSDDVGPGARANTQRERRDLRDRNLSRHPSRILLP